MRFPFQLDPPEKRVAICRYCRRDLYNWQEALFYHDASEYFCDEHCFLKWMFRQGVIQTVDLEEVFRERAH